jgi:phosphatidate cytidylyltransferase
MIAVFGLVIISGPFAFMGLVILLQMKSFHEIISITYQVYKSYKLPWVRTLSWYFLFCANYFFYGEIVTERFAALISSEEILTFFMHYHRMISLSLYLAGFVLFVLSLVKYHYRLQFYMFAWTHMVLLLIVTQSHLLIQNLLEGLIWLIVPVMMVITNDCFAYICGFFFGRTPLIKLSPKKTWEGFIGGALFTILFGWFVSGFLAQFSYLTCPSEVSSNLSVNLDCEPMPIFQMQTYNVPLFIKVLFKPFWYDFSTVELLPFQLHCLAFSIFASSIAPFGLFFASGFKRAFKIKDFADTIPGHGGVVDRFDCQILMATFVNVYYSTFIKLPSANKLFRLITMMGAEEQVSLYNDLQQHLTTQGLLQ